MNVHAAQGVAVREFVLATGHGYADYLLFVDGRAVGVLEAKPEGHTLSGVEVQADRYARGLPKELKTAVRPLPYLYLSTGVITRFTNLLDPDARARELFAIHRPETLAGWTKAETLDAWVRSTGAFTSADATKPSSLRARLRAMPTVVPTGLRAVQFEAITNLEHSFSLGHPRALVQMATGAGKTIAVRRARTWARCGEWSSSCARRGYRGRGRRLSWTEAHLARHRRSVPENLSPGR